MRQVLSIDPGKRGAGATLWRGDELVTATYVPNPQREGGGPKVAVALARAVCLWARDLDPSRNLSEVADVLVVEWPQTYGGRSSRGDTNDLFPLACLDGALAAILAEADVHYYVAHDWKGGVEKPKTTKEPYAIVSKIEDRLSPAEKARVDWTKNVKHSWDVADSIGVGLKWLGRFERIRMYPSE